MARVINKISIKEENEFKKTIKPYTYTLKTSTGKTTTVVVRVPPTDRVATRADIEKKLKAAGIPFKKSMQGGSTGSTDVIFENHKVKIIYKPTSGGMAETTLNSTITELVPAVLFMSNKKANYTDIDKMYARLVELIPKYQNSGVFVGANDLQAGIEFVRTMPSSSKFKEKMENAAAILKYLKQEHAKSPIKQVYWGYRSKPANIDASHKGDLFIEYANGNWLGVSLKAGGEKTAEPQLNTYVNKFFEDFGRTAERDRFKKKIYKEIHSTIGLDEDWDSRAKRPASVELITAYKNKFGRKYDELYDKMLELVRTELIKQTNKDMADTIAYIRKQVIKKDENVPLVVVKAFGKNYKMVTDEDALEKFLPKVTSISAKKSNTSKQNWDIALSNKTQTLVMNMSIRSNKPLPNNKIAQGFNLAVKFNGLAK